MRADLEEQRRLRSDQELAFKQQVSQLIDNLKLERNEQTRLRTSLADAAKENKGLRQQLHDELKKQFQACTSCIELKQKLRKCQDETEFTQELYFGQKT